MTTSDSMGTSTSSASPTSSGDESLTTPENMPRHPPASRGFPFKRPEIDLSAVLSVEQMKQLEILMIKIMDELQIQVRDSFDKMRITPVEPTEGITAPKAIVLSVPNPGSDKYRNQYGNIGIPVTRPDFDDREVLLQIMKSHPVNQNTAKPKPILTIPKSPDEATASSKRTETQLAIASLTELKRDALGHIGKWRGIVLKRLREVVIKNGGNSGQAVRQGPHYQTPGDARRSGFAARGSCARPTGEFFYGDCRYTSSFDSLFPFLLKTNHLPPPWGSDKKRWLTIRSSALADR